MEVRGERWTDGGSKERDDGMGWDAGEKDAESTPLLSGAFSLPLTYAGRTLLTPKVSVG